MNKLLPKTANNPKGFTLIELMVAIAIVAILATVGVTVFQNTQQNARNAKRRADIDAISSALEANFNSTTAKYPALTGSMFAGGAIPKDPQTGNDYPTVPTADIATYSVCATLEPSGTYCKTQQQ